MHQPYWMKGEVHIISSKQKGAEDNSGCQKRHNTKEKNLSSAHEHHTLDKFSIIFSRYNLGGKSNQ